MRKRRFPLGAIFVRPAVVLEATAALPQSLLVAAGGLMSALNVAAAELELRYQNRTRIAALESRSIADSVLIARSGSALLP
ncbi:hypothetical protein WQE_33086 [Paraburkholderia hospita]|uniref:Uncharacterized protein n=1 Tax=Paraburkholderia hospita TaxID=169430 RepID=A0ABP2PH01_9BURK|nr:hypothetical protein WQE_33086 [Paraburkholderia hospita]OUL82551.1 hypothetical protein CA601_29245 [Paraburkholderia hospita]